jgi:hypothetical protein
MATTFTKIASVSVGSGGASSIQFTSIPNTYTDLCIKFSGRSTGNDVDNTVTLNATGKTSGIRLYGNGSGTASDTAVGGGLVTPSSATASTFGSTEYYLPNYLSSSQKSLSIDAVNENNGTSAYANLSAQLFNLTVAVTSITLANNTDNYAQYSTATLYGIKSS